MIQYGNGYNTAEVSSRRFIDDLCSGFGVKEGVEKRRRIHVGGIIVQKNA